jgi:hypothetical protein
MTSIAESNQETNAMSATKMEDLVDKRVKKIIE